MKKITVTFSGTSIVIPKPYQEYTFEATEIEVRDEYHSMSELYEHRMALNAAMFNFFYAYDKDIRGIESERRAYIVKSKHHNDGTMFEGGYFIVMMNGPDGQISYHYKLEHWDKFKIPEVERIPWIYDGHTSQDILERLLKL